MRGILAHIKPDQKLPGKERDQVLTRIKAEPVWVDHITLSASLLFSMNYVKTYEELVKSTMYNKVKATNYSAAGYLEGVTTIHEDYRAVFERYKQVEGVIFLIDPPYLSTDCSTYENYWKLKDYLDVMLCLMNISYIYFTSNKSNIVELCEWIETNTGGANPFNGATTQSMCARPSYNTNYTDMMIYKYI